jgi:hypothetical protein
MNGESKIELIESRTRFFSTSYLYQRGFDLLPFETVRAMVQFSWRISNDMDPLLRMFGW